MWSSDSKSGSSRLWKWGLGALVAIGAATVSSGQEFAFDETYNDGVRVRFRPMEDSRFHVVVTVPHSATTGFLAFGLSTNARMGGSEVVLGCEGCFDGDTKVNQFKTSGYSIQDAERNEGEVSDAFFSIENGEKRLEFKAASINGRSFVAQDTTHFLYASGASIGNGHRSGTRRAVSHLFQIPPSPTSSPTTKPTTVPTQAPVTIDAENVTRAPTSSDDPSLSPTLSPSSAPTSETINTESPTSSPVGDGDSVVNVDFTNKIAVLGNSGTFFWSVVNDTVARRVLHSGHSSDAVMIRGRLEIALPETDNSPRWVGIGIGERMLDSHVLLAFPPQGLASFEGQSSDPVAEYYIPGGIDKLTAGTETVQVAASDRRLVASKVEHVGKKMVVEFMASGFGKSSFSHDEQDSVMFVHGLSAFYSYHDANVDMLSIGWGAGASSTDATMDQKKLFAHGLLMVCAFAYLFPLGAGASVLRSYIGTDGRWFKVHQGFQWIALFAAVSAFAVVLTIPGMSISSTHGILGLVLICVACLQALLPYGLKSSSFRQQWRMSHFLFGFFLFIGGLYNCFAGLDLIRNYLTQNDWVDALELFLYVGAGVCGLLTILVAVNRFRKRNMDEKLQPKAAQDVAKETEEKEMAKPEGETGTSSGLIDVDLDEVGDGNSFGQPSMKGNPGPFFEYKKDTKNDDVTVLNLT